MSKLSREELEQIVERDLPDYKISEDSTCGKHSEEGRDSLRSAIYQQAEASTPDMKSLRDKYLREKYLGHDAVHSGNLSNEVKGYGGDSDDDDDEIVAIKPQRAAAHPYDRSVRPKAAVISGSEKKVIGQQG